MSEADRIVGLIAVHPQLLPETTDPQVVSTTDHQERWTQADDVAVLAGAEARLFRGEVLIHAPAREVRSDRNAGAIDEIAHSSLNDFRRPPPGPSRPGPPARDLQHDSTDRGNVGLHDRLAQPLIPVGL